MNRNGLIEEREWRSKAKDKLSARLPKMTTVKGFNQVLKVIEGHKAEIVKINHILKDGVVK